MEFFVNSFQIIAIAMESLSICYSLIHMKKYFDNINFQRFIVRHRPYIWFDLTEIRASFEIYLTFYNFAYLKILLLLYRRSHSINQLHIHKWLWGDSKLFLKRLIWRLETLIFDVLRYNITQKLSIILKYFSCLKFNVVMLCSLN